MLNGHNPTERPKTVKQHKPDKVELAYEAAARKLCKLRGIDPDALNDVMMERGKISDVHENVPNWCLAVTELMQFTQVMTALRETSAAPTERRHNA